MKQAIIELKKKLLLVELPEGAINIRTNRSMIFYKVSRHLYQYSTGFKIYLVGKLTDITEEQFEQWVEWNEESQYYKDYRKEGWQGDITVYESFFSYLESNRIYFESQDTLDKPNRDDYDFGHGHNEAELYNKHLKSWQEAQEKVWDINNCWIFEIINL